MTVKRYECKVMTPVANLKIDVYTRNANDASNLAKYKAARIMKRLTRFPAHEISIIHIHDHGKTNVEEDSLNPTLVLGK